MASQQPKSECEIHDEVDPSLTDDIRKNVCAHGTPLEVFRNKTYCLFHLPDEYKNPVRFEKIFRERLTAANTTRTFLNLRYVWFPPTCDFKKCQYSTDVSFRAATFGGEADFSTATFEAEASFRSANFIGKADFRKATFKADASFTSARFCKEADFYKATFTTAANFNSAKFLNGSRAEFRKSSFKAADFEDAVFSGEAFFGNSIFSEDVRFHKAEFNGVTETFFNEANFAKNTYFDDAKFKHDVSFNSAVFGNDSDFFFLRSFFGGNADFQYCAVEGYLRFTDLQWGGEKPRFNFQGSLVENASRISFESMPLCPNWFVNVDARKFVFFESSWQNYAAPRKWKRPSTWFRKNKNIDDELSAIKSREIRERKKRLYEILMLGDSNSDSRRVAVSVASRKYEFTNDELTQLPEIFQREVAQISRADSKEQEKHRLLILGIAARQLADNAEANNRYEEASRFRLMAMETNLLEFPRFRRFKTLSWWYRLSSEYGESWPRALLMLVVILFFFALFYVAPCAKFEQVPKEGQGIAHKFCEDYLRIRGNSSGMNLCDGVAHSFAVAAFQRPDPKPDNSLTKFLVALESIFAPLQAALLVLAIRRKFMR